MANDLTLSQALAKIEALTADLTTARASVESLNAQVTNLTTAAGAHSGAITAAVEAATKPLNEKLAAHAITIADLTAKNSALEGKEQDIATRATALAVQTMAGIGQPPVASTKTASGAGTSAADAAKPDYKALAKAKGISALQASIDAGLDRSGTTNVLRRGDMPSR